MSYLVIILAIVALFIIVKLKIENDFLKTKKKKAIQKVKQNIHSIQEKQTEIIDKVLLNKSYNEDLYTEIKELSKEVLALHQDFIKKYTK
jgi:cell shape-determining protein MreC